MPDLHPYYLLLTPSLELQDSVNSNFMCEALHTLLYVYGPLNLFQSVRIICSLGLCIYA
jgi:hypothetical protein